MSWLDDRRGLKLSSYDELQRWSVDDLEGFWSAIWEFYRDPCPRALRARARRGARCPARSGSRARASTTPSTWSAATRTATRSPSLAQSQTRPPLELTFGELRELVGRARAGLQRLGVGPGDRVVAYLPNIPETLAAFIATASLGAIWATCAPEFGARSVDRPLRADRAAGDARGRRLRLPRPLRRPSRRGRGDPRARCRRSSTWSGCPTATRPCPTRPAGTS